MVCLLRDIETPSSDRLNVGGGVGGDHLYSVAALTDTTGAVVERYGYDAYGDSVVTDASGTPLVGSESLVGNPYRFTGRRLDGKTGLMYFRARYLDTSTGVFMSRDPYGSTLGWSYYGFINDGRDVELVNYALDYSDMGEYSEDGYPDFLVGRAVPYLYLDMEFDYGLTAGEYYVEGLNLYYGTGMDQSLDPSGMQRRGQGGGQGGGRHGGAEGGNPHKKKKQSTGNKGDKHTNPRPGRHRARRKPGWKQHREGLSEDDVAVGVGIGTVVVVVILVACDGPLPFGDAAAAVLVGGVTAGTME